MIAASAVLALLVGGVFIALILALADLREAREDEARSKDVTREALGLERQVLEVDSGLSTYVITNSPVLLERYRESRRELETKLGSFRSGHVARTAGERAHGRALRAYQPLPHRLSQSGHKSRKGKHRCGTRGDQR